MIFIVFLIVAFALGFIGWLFEDRMGSICLSCLCFIISVAIGLVGAVMGLCYLSSSVDYDADCYAVAATRSVYIEQLREYDEMRDVDVTASPTYIELREKVVKFNTEIERARNLNSPWFKYIFYSPQYLTVEPIEM